MNVSPESKPCRGVGWGGKLFLNMTGGETQGPSWDLLRCSKFL